MDSKYRFIEARSTGIQVMSQGIKQKELKYSAGPRAVLITFLRMAYRLNPDLKFTQSELQRRLPSIKHSYWNTLRKLVKDGYLAREFKDNFYHYKLGPKKCIGAGSAAQETIAADNRDLFETNQNTVLTVTSFEVKGNERIKNTDKVVIQRQALNSLRVAKTTIAGGNDKG